MMWIDREIDNVRAAFRWAAANVGDLARFRLRHEAANWAAEVADIARSTRHPRLSVLLTWASSNAWALGHFDEARRFGEEAVSLRDDPQFYPFVWAFTDLSAVALHQGDLDRAVALVETGAAHEADRHDRLCLASIPWALAWLGRYPQAIAAAADAAARVEAAGAPFSLAIFAAARGLALSEADPPAAIAAFDQALAVSQRSGNRLVAAMVASLLAALQARAGDPQAALRSLLQTLIESRGSVDRGFFANTLSALVVSFERLGRTEPAAVLHGAAMRDFALLVQASHEKAAARVRQHLGEVEFQRLAEKGAAMPIFEIAGYAVSEIRGALPDDE